MGYPCPTLAVIATGMIGLTDSQKGINKYTNPHHCNGPHNLNQVGQKTRSAGSRRPVWSYWRNFYKKKKIVLVSLVSLALPSTFGKSSNVLFS